VWGYSFDCYDFCFYVCTYCVCVTSLFYAFIVFSSHCRSYSFNSTVNRSKSEFTEATTPIYGSFFYFSCTFFSYTGRRNDKYFYDAVHYADSETISDILSCLIQSIVISGCSRAGVFAPFCSP
jgi:hypothetical protein